MNEEDKLHIQKNLVQLLDNTRWNPKLAAILLSNNALSSYDVDEIFNEKIQLKMAKRFYDIIVTKAITMQILHDAFLVSKQSGAAKILKPLDYPDTVTGDQESLLEGAEYTAEYQEQTQDYPGSSNENSCLKDSWINIRKCKAIKPLILVLALLLIAGFSYYISVFVIFFKENSCQKIHSVDIITKYTISDLAELEGIMESVDAISALHLTIELVDGNNCSSRLLSTMPQVVSITLQGCLCTELILSLLKQTVCVTEVYFNVGQTSYCTYLETGVTYVKLDTKVKLPYVRNLTTVGTNLKNNLLFTIADKLEISNLTTIKFLYMVIGSEEIKSIRLILNQLTQLTYLEIRAVFNITDTPLLSNIYPLVNVKHIVYNSYENISFLEKGKGIVNLSKEFCKLFPHVTSFVNSVGNLDRQNSEDILKCGDLKVLELGILVDSKEIYVKFPINDNLSNIERVRVRLEFSTNPCPVHVIFQGLENLNLIRQEVNAECINNPKEKIPVTILPYRKQAIDILMTFFW